MKIIGIDPGTNLLGFAVLDGSSKNNPILIFSGKLKLSSYSNHYIKLERIYNKISQIVQEYKPDFLSIEAPFFGKNIQSMLKLGRAQGVAMAAALSAGVEIIEYSPRKIKQAITGNGDASKEQVALMIKSILNLKELPDSFDESDAIAAALCHFYQKGSVNKSKSYSDWGDFIKKNPNKVVKK